MLARDVARALVPENGRQPLARMRTAPVEKEITQQETTLLVGKASQGLVNISNLTGAEEF
jgi:hypothetical protein